MAALTRGWLAKGLSVGFVPTMGALHEGHASLIARARRENDRVAVSIFVNPKQFGPHEDYSRYPRTFPADRALCAASGADAVYHPAVAQVYPPGFSTSVEVSDLQDGLCGPFRPGHFRGVATVVLELLNTVRPTRAYFGEKDYQQLAIIRRMALDLHLDARIVGCPTVREPGGLARSSRNAYLAPEQRRAAGAIYAALSQGARAAKAGAAPRAVEAAVARQLRRALPQAKIDYVSLVDARTLAAAQGRCGRLRLLTALRLGKTRLIDNIPVSL